MIWAKFAFNSAVLGEQFVTFLVTTVGQVNVKPRKFCSRSVVLSRA
jgi:hypothetical protein